MTKYLIVSVPHKGDTQYYISASRDAIAHCRKAKAVWVYDKDGWLLSMAEWDSDTGKINRIKPFLDGEPKKYYAQKFRELAGDKKLFPFCTKRNV